MKKSATNRAGNVPVKWDAKKERWQLRTFAGGKERKQFFRTEREAVKVWTGLAERAAMFGAASREFSQADHAELQEARRLVGGADLREVARFYAAHNLASLTPQFSVKEAVVLFLGRVGERGLSARHVKTLTYTLGAFVGEAGARGVREVGRGGVLDWLLKMRAGGASARTVKNHFSSLSNFFNWCKREGIVGTSATENISQGDLPVIVRKQPGTLSVAQCAALMEWVEVNAPQFAAWFALQFFAGVRNAEVSRLRWGENFNFEERVLLMPAWRGEGEDAERIVKTDNNWAMRGLPANLWAWLERYRGKDGERVLAPSNKATSAMHEIFAGLPVPIPHWPHNAPRHTFCTMLMSLYKSADMVANWSRHTSARQLYGSYVAQLVSEQEARRFCEIVPTR
jgi:integrase